MCHPPFMPPALLTLHRWLDSWSGIGVIERGMARQGYDLALTRFANEGWRATFYLWGQGTLIQRHHRVCVGEDTVASRPACGVGHLDEDGTAASGLRFYWNRPGCFMMRIP